MSIKIKLIWVLLITFSMISTKVNLALGMDKNLQESWEKYRLGPINDLKVYWVGHSLMEGKRVIDGEEEMILTLVGKFAKAKGYKYSYGDHTRWGTPLSGMWRGKPHVWSRDATPMIAKRERFQKEAKTYNAMVLTEGVPVGGPIKDEYSSYYLQQFYCTLMSANPNARVYLYEGWVNYHGNEHRQTYGPQAQFDWRKRMLQDRKLWEQIADQATDRRVPAPGYISKIKAVFSKPEPACAEALPIFIVPTGTALVKLEDRLKSPKPGDHFQYADGKPFEFGQMFLNTYADWPKDWPLSAESAKSIDEKAVISKLTLRDPKLNPDDIHASDIGVYYNSLVHFATIYRTTPIGLPVPSFIGEKFGKTLQCIAWEVVVNDHRSGVKDDGQGCQVN